MGRPVRRTLIRATKIRSEARSCRCFHHCCPPHEYPSLAKALKWTVEDLLPPDDWDAGDGTKVEKIVLSLINPEDMQLVLEGMMEYGAFNESKSLLEIVKHLYLDREDKKEERQMLERVLEELVKEGKLHEKGGYIKKYD